jgi:MerR family transcriptional regulator, heat shock protein HspR
MTQPDLGHDRALYSISVTSELTGVNPQMLRVYESKGLLDPYRTTGGTRRYSGRDLDRIGEITTLLAAGLNLAGVEHVLRLQAETGRLQAEIDGLRQQLHLPRKRGSRTAG